MRHTIIIAAVLATAAPAALAVPVLQQSVVVQGVQLNPNRSGSTFNDPVAQCNCILTGATVGLEVKEVVLAIASSISLDHEYFYQSVTLPTVISGPGFTLPVQGTLEPPYGVGLDGYYVRFFNNDVPPQALSSSVLSQYVGMGSVNVVSNAGRLPLDLGPNALIQYLPHAALPLDVAYSYYSHAAPALSATGDKAVFIDFGEVKRNSGLLTQSVNLFNTAQFGSDTLDLLSAKAFNKSLSKTFTTTLAPFTGQIDGGASQAFNISLNTKRSGQFIQIYTLNFADTNIGGIGEQSYAPERIVVTGIVDPGPSNAVPAPGAAALLGLGGVALIARRRRA